MTTKTIQTLAGEIPSPYNWAHPTMQQDPEILFLEKATDGRVTLEDIGPALDEYKRLFKAGIASPAEIMTLTRAYPESSSYAKELKKMNLNENDEAMVIGGPASIELVDREGHLITTAALDKAFIKYMKNFRTRNAMVLHSDVQVGWALPAYISKGGQIFKSGVDDKGLFFITELRNDTKISEKVMEQIKEGKLKSYSIAGSAVKTQNIQKGLQNIMQVDELELAEVTVCEKGVNQGAAFDILKAEGAATSSCIDGSCLISKEESCNCGCNDSQGVELMVKSSGDIDFTQSFFNFIKKEGLEGESFPTLMNTQGRQEEHHRLLDAYGFPGELEPENARYTPVIEEDPSLCAHRMPPWVVNEAGQNLGERYYEDALTTPQLGAFTKRGVAEGANSTETPVAQLNPTDAFNTVLAKADNFFDWMEQHGKHIYKESCPCEQCFNKSTDYKGTKELSLEAVVNPFASEGSGEMTEALKKSRGMFKEIGFLLQKGPLWQTPQEKFHANAQSTAVGSSARPLKIQQTHSTAVLSGRDGVNPEIGGYGKSLGREAAEHKYIKREPKPGGGWTYIYPEDIKTDHSIDMSSDDHRKEASKLIAQLDGHPTHREPRRKHDDFPHGEPTPKNLSLNEAASHHLRTAKAKENYPKHLVAAIKSKNANRVKEVTGHIANLLHQDEHSPPSNY